YVIDGEEEADVAPLSLRVENDVVLFAGGVFDLWVAQLRIFGVAFADRRAGHAAPLRVKAAGIRRERSRGKLLVIDVIPESNVRDHSIVFQRDSCAFLEGHGEVGNQSVEIPGAEARVDAHGEGMEVSERAEARTEEVSHWDFDAGLPASVPIHAQDELA